MIKGIQRNMVVLKNTESRVFEEAYFVLRDDRDRGMKKSDMIAEANRIITENLIGPDRKNDKTKAKRERRLKLVFFLLGILCGALLGTAVGGSL